jgi:hypothetical protein
MLLTYVPSSSSPITDVTVVNEKENIEFHNIQQTSRLFRLLHSIMLAPTLATRRLAFFTYSTAIFARKKQMQS